MTAALISAACSSPSTDAERQADAEVCETVIDAVSKHGLYQRSQIAGCEIVESASQGHRILRLNAHCREDVCGSVLLGWYAVEIQTGRVVDWNIAESTAGEEVDIQR